MVQVVENNPDNVNYVNIQRGKSYSNTYNPGWLDHPNFFYKNNKNALGPRPRKSNLEIMIASFMETQTRQNEDVRNQNLHTNDFLRQLASKVESVTILTKTSV